MAQTQNWLWANNAGGESGDEARSIAVDSFGNSYVTGYFHFTATFGTITLIAQDPTEIFIAKLDNNGNWLWANKVEGNASNQGWGVAVDDSSNVYVSGYFANTATFGTTTLTSYGGDDDIFVAKLDNNGNWIWAKNAGGTGSDECFDLAVDANANVYITGYFTGTAIFGAESLTCSGSEDVFISKLNSSGDWLWTKKTGGTSFDSGYSLTVDSNANVYLTGWFANTATFGTTTLFGSGSFITKLNSGGDWLWATSAEGANYGVRCYSIAVDSNANVYLTGYFQGTAVFGSTSLTSNGNDDLFVAKLNNSGEWLWAKKAGGTGFDIGRAIDVDSSANIYLAGQTQGSLFFDTTELQGNFIVKFDNNGNYLWSTDIGNIWGINALALNGTQIYFAGAMYDYCDLGSIHLTSHGGVDILVASIDSGAYLSNIDTNINFEAIYVNDISEYQSITISNVGGANLIISSIHFVDEQLHFEYQLPEGEIMILPGEQDSILIRFTPQTVGTLIDTLFIESNAVNLPILKIRLMGTGMYVPPEIPQNLVITPNGLDMNISWQPVTQDIHGNPITPDYYFIYFNGLSDINAPYYFLGLSFGTTFIHPYVTLGAEYMFYRVKAIKLYRNGRFEGSGSGDIEELLKQRLKVGMTEKEVEGVLRDSYDSNIGGVK